MTLIDEIRIHPEEGAKRLESECKPGLQALARRLCSDEGDAEELVNRTLAEAISHIDSLISRPALFGWMCQILVDCHAKDNRRKSRSAEAPDNETVAAAVDEDAEARLFREVDAGILRDAIETLPDDIRKTVVMHYFMGVPVREAAKVLSVPTGTVAWRLHYARMLLAAKLGAAAKKPGAKALLVALVLAALTAVGATVATIVGEARNTPPALSEGTPLSEGGHAAQDSSPLQEGGCRRRRLGEYGTRHLNFTNDRRHHERQNNCTHPCRRLAGGRDGHRLGRDPADAFRVIVRPGRPRRLLGWRRKRRRGRP